MDATTPLSEIAMPWRLLDGYQPRAGVYDEMLAPGGTPRPHVDRFVRSLEALGRGEATARWESARRTIRDNGITYNVYGDPQGVDRPWTLDMVPLIIPPFEWSRLEAALIQRTRLLNLILSDLYGPQRLLNDRLLPPSLVLANPAFLRPCHGVTVPNGVHLHLHAVDLARSPDGQWWVLADRTQAPSGAGYTLENRIVLSRSLAEAFRDCQVERLAPFFRTYRDTLMGMTPGGSGRVVVLTPGPLNETYFEHAFLARYLGFTLVEGGDLTVRDRQVFIKTLDGLQKVDVIFRRLDDGYCDPLELRGDSTLGVAGLVEAVRAGSVAVANAIGAGVVETAAITPFLPGLCRHLLGEDLQLSSAPAWWCGDAGQLPGVLDRLGELVIKRAFLPATRQPVFGRTLSAPQRTALTDEIRARPAHFVAQSEMALSTAPVLAGSTLEPRPIVLRMYVAAAGDSWAVMPGGLTRVAADSDVPIVSMQRGGASKDTWVLSEGPVSGVTLLAPGAIKIERERRSGDLPSRVADNLFWLGRYAERSENTIRLFRAIVTLMTAEDTTAETPELVALLRVMTELELLPPALSRPMPQPALEQAILSLVLKPNSQTRLRQTLVDLRRIAAAVRDRLSVDTWRILNQLRDDIRPKNVRPQLDDMLVQLNRMITDLAAFSGMEMENMTRGHGWRFLDIGRRLERAFNGSKLLRNSFSLGPEHHAMLPTILDVADSVITYRRRYFAEPHASPVLDLVLADETNTRSVAFQLEVLADHLAHLPRDPRAPSPTREQSIVARILDQVRSADLDALGQPDPAGGFVQLVSLLQSSEDDLRALSDTVTHYYFSHAELRVS